MPESPKGKLEDEARVIIIFGNKNIQGLRWNLNGCGSGGSGERRGTGLQERLGVVQDRGPGEPVYGEAIQGKGGDRGRTGMGKRFDQNEMSETGGIDGSKQFLTGGGTGRKFVDIQKKGGSRTDQRGPIAAAIENRNARGKPEVVRLAKESVPGERASHAEHYAGERAWEQPFGTARRYQRQPDCDACTDSGGTLERDGSAHLVDQTFYDGQAEAGADAGGSAAGGPMKKWFKDGIVQFRGNAITGVFDAKLKKTYV
jgi:hypothetical protein